MSVQINKYFSQIPYSGGGATLFDKIWEKHIVKKIDDLIKQLADTAKKDDSKSLQEEMKKILSKNWSFACIT